MALDRKRDERGARINPGLVIAGGALLAAVLLKDRSRREKIGQFATKAAGSAIAMAKTNRAPSLPPAVVTAGDSAFREKIERAKRPVRTAAPSTTSAPTIENEPKAVAFTTSAPTIERAPKASTVNTTARFVARVAPSISHALSTCEMLASAPRICAESPTKLHAWICGRAIAAPTTRKARGSRAAPFVALGVSRGETRGHAPTLGRAAPFVSSHGVREGPRVRSPTFGRAAPFAALRLARSEARARSPTFVKADFLKLAASPAQRACYPAGTISRISYLKDANRSHAFTKATMFAMNLPKMWRS